MVAALLAALALAAAAGDVRSTTRITTKTGVRTRAAADPKAAVVDRVPLGTALPCLAESAPVDVDGTTATFCKTKTAKGEGWFFTALTALVEADTVFKQDAQLARIAAPYVKELAHAPEARWPDVYEVQSLLARRAKLLGDAGAPGEQVAARVDETAFVARNPAAFASEPRIEADPLQGARMRREALQELLLLSKGTAAHDDALWLSVTEGSGGECEDEVWCTAIGLTRTSCRYLETYPRGAHAREALLALDVGVAHIGRQSPRELPKEVAARLDACVAAARPLPR
jgi:hypothetical protein